MRSYVEKIPWSEDLQSEYLSRIADAYMSFKNIAGEIIWTFADFRVSNWIDISKGPAHLHICKDQKVLITKDGGFYPAAKIYLLRDEREILPMARNSLLLRPPHTGKTCEPGSFPTGV